MLRLGAQKESAVLAYDSVSEECEAPTPERLSPVLVPIHILTQGASSWVSLDKHKKIDVWILMSEC